VLRREGFEGQKLQQCIEGTYTWGERPAILLVVRMDYVEENGGMKMLLLSLSGEHTMHFNFLSAKTLR
jgi:hypothetical protein